MNTRPENEYAVRPGGDFFDVTRREAVAGSFVARSELGLKLGDKFHPYHGLTYDEKNQHAETYVIVGILKPSNTPADRVIWIPLEGIQKMSGCQCRRGRRGERGAGQIEGSGAAPPSFRCMDLAYNKQGDRLTFAWPIGQVVAELFNKIGWFDKVLALVSYLVALVAAASILASIYNSMNERRREIAILRALGARRRASLGAIVLEAATISALGMVIAFVFYFAIMTVAAGIIRSQTGVVLNPFQFNPVMLWAPAVLIMPSARWRGWCRPLKPIGRMLPNISSPLHNLGRQLTHHGP